MLKHFDAPRPTVAALSAALAVLGLAAHPVLAADDVSRWDGDARSAARLIAGAGTPDQHALRAGVEIRLTAGWHTYWRYPGDAGVPPNLDFAELQNVKTVDVLWPAPRRLSEDGLTTIGYDHDVILPLEVTPQDPTKAVGLRLKLGYAICEKLCVPAEAKLALTLASGASPQMRRSPPPKRACRASSHSAKTTAASRSAPFTPKAAASIRASSSMWPIRAAR